MNFKSAIFDMDGTILDSMHVWQNIGIQCLEFLNVDYPENIEQTIEAMTMHEAAHYLSSNFKLEQTPEQILEYANKNLEDKYKNMVILKPYVVEYLEFLKSKNVKMALATATDRNLAEPALKRLDVLKYFDFTITCREAGQNKSKPDIYLICTKQLGSTPSETAIFEDAYYCIKTAKKAGFYVFGVEDKWANGWKDEIIGCCDKYITSFKELL